MIKKYALPLLASTFLIAPAAHAQDSEIESLRAQVSAMQAQIQELSQRLDQYQHAAPTAPQAPAVAATPASAPVAAPAPAANDGIEISFAGAPEIEGAGGWSFKPFGRIMVDTGFTSLPAGLAASDGFGSEIRRARLGMSGDIPGGFGYKFEVDFAGNSAELTDAIITYEDGGLELTAGQHNNFQGLEELTSSRFSSFIERAAFTDAFGFERRLGLSAQYKTGDLLLQGGVFSDNIDDLPGKNWSLDGRAVYSPKLGDTQLHLGGSLHLAQLESGNTVRYRQRPLVHFTSERLINTGNLAADSEFGAGLEAAVIAGPFHAAGEAYWQNVDRPAGMTDPTFFGGYAEVGYYLTGGDSRGYKGSKFDRTRPNSPIDEGGIGAIEVNLRYDYLDLADGTIIGGQQNGYLASLIWVPTDYTRLSFNYGHLEYDDAVIALPSGSRSYSADVAGVRAQVDF
ncbi:porin [Alteraurantiacibacter aestuarii]|uniref:porin n=1 Tax=Alteraurantiacibacter aestuarii TaxID=650004 RepID=UPI0031DC37B1